MVRLLVISILLAAFSLSDVAAADVLPKGWEQVKSESREDAKVVVKDLDIEISTSRSSIQVSSAHPVQIKVFTILGRLVSEAAIPAGAYRIFIPTHGVYIVKAGTLTCKVAL